MTPDDWLLWICGWIWRALLLSLPMALVILWSRRRSTPVRYRMVLWAMACLLLLPPLFLLLPKTALASSSGEWGNAVAAVAERFFNPAVLVTFWALGAVVAGLRLLRAAGIVAGWRRRAEPWRGWRPEDLKTRIRVCAEIDRPLAVGLWSPVILLPLAAEHWDGERLRLVLLHEQAHIDRRDLWFQWLGRIAGVVYWFNPLVWWLTAQLVEARELATDEAVVEQIGGDGRGYALELLRFAEEGAAMAERSATLTVAAMAGEEGSSLERRVRCILDRRRHSPTDGRLGFLLLAQLLLVAVLAVSCCVVDRHASSLWSDQELRLRLSADPFPGN